MASLKGSAHKFGDNIDTDVIIPSRYCVSFDPKELGAHAMEGLDAGFAKRVKPGDFIVGEKNFGCGSSREQAPLALKGVGLAGAVAASFARIFFRNAINLGFPVFESPEAAARIAAGDQIEIFPDEGRIVNITKGEEYKAAPYEPFLKSIIEAGGMVEYVKRKLNKAG
jgi:3-isopropylmalate/(R)-2-methylmalate dehydratase small subunit